MYCGRSEIGTFSSGAGTAASRPRAPVGPNLALVIDTETSPAAQIAVVATSSAASAPFILVFLTLGKRFFKKKQKKRKKENKDFKGRGERILYHLCLLLLARLGGYMVNLSNFYSYRLIGKLTVFLTVSGVQLSETHRGLFHFRLTAFVQQFKSRVVLTLTKSTLRITLN
jgi:hypothetical protein